MLKEYLYVILWKGKKLTILLRGLKIKISINQVNNKFKLKLKLKLKFRNINLKKNI